MAMILRDQYLLQRLAAELMKRTGTAGAPLQERQAPGEALLQLPQVCSPKQIVHEIGCWGLQQIRLNHLHAWVVLLVEVADRIAAYRARE